MSYDNPRASELKYSVSVLKVSPLFRRTMVMEPPSPQCVGREFVRQYYTLLNQVSVRQDVLHIPEKYLRAYKKNNFFQAPLHLHRFYSHNSSFVHGGLENNEAVFGQQEIHQKIMTLNFRDCHAKIRQVTKRPDS